MIEDVLKTPYFYFSKSYDLSHSLQALDLNSPDFFQVLNCFFLLSISYAVPSRIVFSICTNIFFSGNNFFYWLIANHHSESRL